MNHPTHHTKLAFNTNLSAEGLFNAVEMWARARTTADSNRLHDLLRDKMHALIGEGEGGAAAGFFVFVKKSPEAVTPTDIVAYRDYLLEMGLAPTSIYARISRISSFFTWLLNEPTFKARIKYNPVDLARPKAPQAYGTERANTLTDDQVRQLLLHVARLALGDNLSAKRDYALLRFYFATGKRRSEIIGLRGGDVQFKEDYLIIHTKEKGSLYRSSEVRDGGVRLALVNYLKASERWNGKTRAPLLANGEPIWLRHDRARQGKEGVTSHGFVFMLKRYAKEADIGEIHLHQTRHTVARIVGEQAGDLTEVQTVLGHQSLQTTRVYLDRVSIKRDKHSQRIAGRLGIDLPELNQP